MTVYEKLQRMTVKELVAMMDTTSFCVDNACVDMHKRADRECRNIDMNDGKLLPDGMCAKCFEKWLMSEDEDYNYCPCCGQKLFIAEEKEE